MAVGVFEIQDPFAGKNTSALNSNGVLMYRQQDNLVPWMPNPNQVNQSGLTIDGAPLGQPSPMGVRWRLGDVTNPTSPNYIRISGMMGESFGILYGVDIGDTGGSTNNYFQDTVVYIDGEAFIPQRTFEHYDSITPIVANSRALSRAVWHDLGDQPYNVEIRTPGDRTYTPLTSITKSGTTATATVTGTNWLTVGAIVNIAGASDSLYKGLQTVTGVSGSTFTYTMTGTPASNASGTLTIGTPNRFVVYALLVDPRVIGNMGGFRMDSFAVGTVSTSLATVNAWSNSGSQPFGLQQIDITNTTAGALTILMQIDGSNQSHYKTVAANDTLTLFSSPIPLGMDVVSKIKLQADGSGLRYTLIGTAGF